MNEPYRQPIITIKILTRLFTHSIKFYNISTHIHDVLQRFDIVPLGVNHFLKYVHQLSRIEQVNKSTQLYKGQPLLVIC